MQKRSLLMITNSQVLMDLTKKILERADYSVHCAIGIAGAHEQLMDFTPDAIILEDDLPDGKGLDYCRELRGESDIPIMFLSDFKEDELTALQSGASDFLKKPFDFEIMKARINNMLIANSVSSASDDGKDAERNMLLFMKSKGKDWRSQSIQPESEGAIKKKRVFNLKQFHITVAACFILVLAGAGIFPRLANRSFFFETPPGTQVPLAKLPLQMDETAKPYAGAEQCVKFPGIESIIISAGATKVKLPLINPKGNPCYFTFEIILTETGETLFLSGAVEPGMRIDEVEFYRGLSKGEYNACVKIRAYALEDFTALNGANMEFGITAE